ncbi:MAG: c-type cytochrome [Dehalococcoidia bacterium]
MRRYKGPFLVLTLATALAVIVAACGGDDDEPTRRPTSTPTSAPVATATSAPTPTTPPAATPTSPPAATPTPTPPTGDVEAGKQTFLSRGCTACHAISDLPGAVGTIGPALDGLAGRAGQRVSGLSAEEYLRQSVLDPNSFLVDGFGPLMPPGLVSAGDDLDNLVAYLLTLE